MAPKKKEIEKILEVAENARIRGKVEEWFYPPRIVEEPGENRKSNGSKFNYLQHLPQCTVKADRNEPNSLERPQTSDLEERTQKENIRIEFKQALDELKQASEISAQELFNLIYEKHPPKRGNKSTEPLMRSRFKAALLHYHPDKQDLEEDGLNWIVMSEEITVLLTHHFERMRSDPEAELENVTYRTRRHDSSESEDSSQSEDDSDN
ncbi:hypothetical protein DAPPUDRAFT_102049 [Daphnia pulex]|uniref:Uncharacterized protein n=1 Tax=Daphnia pulex TaxID=6669 RepID=E9GF71_DAPPU|nr:hypothetical protein DAPPUDRAFT_102049 [Daphnia pulex]|eukprot:EFX81588.1 hypothetical protein DAPPUDRAFT_102049 [Daphnia pulex]